MQTFLPFPCFEKSAVCLDKSRLNQQRKEALEILVILKSVHEDHPFPSWMGRSWQLRLWSHKQHPAVLMWKGYELQLHRYLQTMDACWKSVGRSGDIGQKGWVYCLKVGVFEQYPQNPPWMNNLKFHESHQSNLLRKDINHYQKFFPDVPDDIPYYWPTKEGYEV